jgi:excisionase family DNA binding protein
MRTYSTVEVAKMLGIAQPNLQRLIKQGRLKAPKVQTIGQIKVRWWTAKQIEQARKVLDGK